MAAMADLEVELRARCWKSSVYQVGCVICQDPEPECQLRLEAVAVEMSAAGPAETKSRKRSDHRWTRRLSAVEAVAALSAASLVQNAVLLEAVA